MADKPDAKLTDQLDTAHGMTLRLADFSRTDQCRIILMIAVALGLPIKLEAHDGKERD